MTLTQQIIMIGVVVLGTMVTRFLPFFIFPQGETCPFLRFSSFYPSIW